jgi:hypothetical protein
VLKFKNKFGTLRVNEGYVILVELCGQGETEVREIKHVPVLFTRKPRMDRLGIEHGLRRDSPVTSPMRHDRAYEPKNILYFTQER